MHLSHFLFFRHNGLGTEKRAHAYLLTTRPPPGIEELHMNIGEGTKGSHKSVIFYTDEEDSDRRGEQMNILGATNPMVSPYFALVRENGLPLLERGKRSWSGS